MHALRGVEDVVVVLEDVMGGESYELAATPEHTAEEVERVEGVGEVGKDSNHNPVVDDLLDSVHPWRSPGEVAVADPKEEVGQLPCTPPP